MSHFKDALSEAASLTDAGMNRLLPLANGPEAQVLEAMRYSCFAGGKRLRPFLVLASSDLFKVSRTCSERVAVAVEMVHTYSLIHDDLPAMDDDDLRRGKPTCHKEFDEATAILAGDGLISLAFEILASNETHESAEIRAELTLELAKAIGAQGMVGGQMLDLVAENHNLDMSEITRLQRMKTGALINYACMTGAILGKADVSQRHQLSAYANNLGLAFQIVDDILDVEGVVEELGKAVNKDEGAGKVTFVSILGKERARDKADALIAQSIKYLENFGEKSNLLKDLADFVVQRRH